MANDKNKGEGLKGLLALVEKKFGKGAIMTMSSDARQNVAVFSTGSVGIDQISGVGGLPFGRIVEIYGPESSGKTTLTLHAIAEVQRMGRSAAFIDAEHALDPVYARAIGVDLDALLISQPSSGEEAMEVAEMLARSGEVGLIVVDSVAALTPRAELEGEMGDAHMGLQARLMGQALRKLTAAANQTGTCIIFINQLRQKIGVVFGSGETTTGGNALKFYASMRVDIRRGQPLKDSDGRVYGARTKVKIVKNKLAPPMRVTEFDILFGRGVCQVGEVIDLGLASGVVDKAGAWLSLGGERLGHGRDKARQALLDNPELFARLKAAVVATPVAQADDAEGDSECGEVIELAQAA